MFLFLHPEVDGVTVNSKGGGGVSGIGTVHSIYENGHWLTPDWLKTQRAATGIVTATGRKAASVKYMALPTSRFKIRDLKHFKDERTHKRFKEEQEAQHIFYYSNLKQAMKWTHWGTALSGWPWLKHNSFQGASSLRWYADLLFNFNCVSGTRKARIQTSELSPFIDNYRAQLLQ